LQHVKLNDVDPHAWLTQILERIAQGWPIPQIDVFMPWELQSLDGLSRARTNIMGSDLSTNGAIPHMVMTNPSMMT